MGTTVIYAVGGTGAKLLESLVHLCAAGIVSQDIKLRIVDQDETNGNVQRLRGLVADYIGVRSWLNSGTGRDRGAAPLFRSEISGAKSPLRVVPQVDETLASAYGLGEQPNEALGDDDLLMQVLFSREERASRMVNGFRGLPAVGAATFLSPVSRDTSPIWTSVDEDVIAARDGLIDQFLLVGSCFGGTGASGVPTLANYLRDALNGLANPPRLGAVLMLRYYDVSARSQYGPAALAQTKTAMEFYDQVLNPRTGASRDRLVDTLYLVGLSPELAVPAEPSGGGKGQANPALMPELLGALGAAHFVERNGVEVKEGRGWRDSEPENPVWLCGHDPAEPVSWSDLPEVKPFFGAQNGATADSFGTRRLLCSFARFAFCYAYGLHAAEQLSRVPSANDLPMYFRLLDMRDLEQGRYDTNAKSLNGFLLKVLRWLGALHLTANDDGTSTENGSLVFRLGDFASLVVAKPEHIERVELRTDPVKMGDLSATERGNLQAIFDSIRISTEEDSLAQVIRRLTVAPLPFGTRRGLTVFVRAAYQAASLRA